MSCEGAGSDEGVMYVWSKAACVAAIDVDQVTLCPSIKPRRRSDADTRGHFFQIAGGGVTYVDADVAVAVNIAVKS